MTLTEGVIVLNRMAEKLALLEDYETLEEVAFVIKQIKDEQTKPKKGKKKW